ncbi:hypothetical protein R3P38DRAFT_2567137 [Favolaschia claudopus]|uniref:Uncharacterized protein n=1 Tax=Favolaschia claudopus TaxID=2862362 RepID=A0AAV9ZWU6_9AGAR
MRPSFGEILTCGIAGREHRGETRLLRIVISESAYLIWKLRNERVIGAKGDASNREIENRWLNTINNRLSIDCLLTNTKKYGGKSIRKSLVLETWRKVLMNEDRLPRDWTRESGGVLVGVG